MGYSLCQGTLIFNKKNIITDNFAILVLFIVGMSRMDSHPFYYGHPDYVASIRLRSEIPHVSGKLFLLLRKFLKKSLIEVNIFIKSDYLFIQAIKKKFD